jgi:phosphoserine phosphatase
MRDLIAKLRAAGFDVWIIDDLPQPVLAASTLDYGVDPSRAYGVQNSTEGARMGADVRKPVPTRGGKTEVVQSLLGRPADLVLGRDSADFDVLSYGDGLRVVLDLDPELVKKAGERGWLVQHAFGR